jgi:hypothetical protein
MSATGWGRQALDQEGRAEEAAVSIGQVTDIKCIAQDL